MKEELGYAFPGDSVPKISEVGGKGLSLIISSREKMPVPPGFVLTVEFFRPWLESIKSSPLWKSFLNSDNTSMMSLCEEIKVFSQDLTFSRQQDIFLDNELKKFPDKTVFAVRSSSPEEDLEGSSFAGIYETRLGVVRSDIKSAVRTVFSSCLDPRIFTYKKEQGFDVFSPQIAVIIQQQIASEISGVCFSINPFTNNYDEVVINSNWGLGETVVSGTVTPDTFIFDRLKRKTRKFTIGKQEKSIWLNADGGTTTRNNTGKAQKTLTAKQVKRITKLVTKVENLYQKPMDIEWAFYNNTLYLLQARPITSYMPLPEEMKTVPGKPKILYQDMTISVQGLYQPISVLGTSMYQQLLEKLSLFLFSSKPDLSPSNALLFIINGRFYINLSNLFEFVNKNKCADFIQNMDPLAAEIIRGLPKKRYKASVSKTPGYRYTALKIFCRTVPYITRGLLFPKYTNRLNHKKFREFEKYTEKLMQSNLQLTEITAKLFKRLTAMIFKNSAPLGLSGRAFLNYIKKLVPDAETEDLQALSLALPNNVTTEMGLELYRLSCEIPESMTSQEFLRSLNNHALPSNTQEAWDKFLRTYGHRCPDELDPKSPRYRDTPETLVEMIFSIKSAPETESPLKNFKRLQVKRNKAFQKIFTAARQKSFIKAKILKFLYRYIETFAGYRETHKYYLIYTIDQLRRKVISQAENLYAEGRIDSINQVFDLTLEELQSSLKDSNYDIRARANRNIVFPNKLRTYPKLPTIFDSRGLILRPPVKEMLKGEISGTPVSAGIASGPVKVMHSPTEKPFNKGDILVARATDPAWTTLFVNASAVILEVGGVLQHGALVAREYGLPCITGVANATSLWKDGDSVEVDGSAGRIRNLKHS
ncbi:PEP/pyruvate-binding domain-containing protein [Lentisphaerota bacterium ZTH]|nr:hypothetical protein JYG24_03305 [Lentisphaerota bacterium]WET07462.1 PEP/pyruvate-binding domain-containing protein [Lentisphaerota bacterium ZTH]